jgi:hypothetical protein
MKPPLPRIQTAVPQLPHVQLEIAKAIGTLMTLSSCLRICTPGSVSV